MCVPLHWNMVKCLVDFPGCTSDLKKNNPPANAEDLRDVGSVPGLGRSPGGGNGNSLQYFCLENSMDKRAWQAISMGSQRVGHNLVTDHKMPSGQAINCCSLR